jgi:uncharacterized protein YbjT (DUF2867 family)
MILVTGATGNVGSEVVKQLALAGHKVRAFVNDTEAAKRLFATGVDIVKGDFMDSTSLDVAFRDIERAYLLAPFTSDLVTHEANVIAAAKRAKVKYVVKHSVLGAQYEGITLGKWHRAGEKLLESSGIGWTFLRPSGFFNNALGWAGMIKQGATVYYPTGDGKLGIVDVRDIAAVAVKALTEPGHEGKSYDVTGPQALTTQEQVDLIGKVIGKPLSFVNVPDQAARDSMVGMGMSEPIVEVMLEFTNLIRAGQAGLVSDTVQKVTGKAPRAFEAWVKETASAFR